jgi:hypothetical protein
VNREGIEAVNPETDNFDFAIKMYDRFQNFLKGRDSFRRWLEFLVLIIGVENEGGRKLKNKEQRRKKEE